MSQFSLASASRPLAFAHRGGSGLRPENTLAAFDHGLALGADGLELDVHLSRDGIVVVHHDTTLERTTNGRGHIAALTADELDRIDAGYWFTTPPAAPPTTIRFAVRVWASRASVRCWRAIPTPPSSSS